MLPTKTTLRRLSTIDPSHMLSRTIHRSCIAQRQPSPPNPVSHSAESYFVDGDDTPPQNPSIYKVDATSDAAESAYEPPSGPWSRAGAGTEYQTLSKDEPSDVPGGRDAKLRYAGMKGYYEDKVPETSEAGDGPEGIDRWGRKPEGRA